MPFKCYDFPTRFTEKSLFSTCFCLLLKTFFHNEFSLKSFLHLFSECRKGGAVPRDFYPFVEEGATEGQDEGPLEVTNPARVAVYDDAAAAPRVVVIEPKGVREYLEEITSTVSSLAREQGGTIPFMVIREIVENFVHAYFQAPTISILDGGDTIRFSDQGPGIREKDRALQYGTSSATEEMKRYIRGVGSGLPYVQQYMEVKGGSLEIEDNISGGTVVTISTRPAGEATVRSEAAGAQAAPPGTWQQPAQQSVPWGAHAPYGWQAPAQSGQWVWQGAPQQPAPGYQPAQQGYQPPAPQYQPAQQAPQQASQYDGRPPAWPQQQGAPQPGAVAPQPAVPTPQPGAQQGAPAVLPQVRLSDRGRQALAYALERGPVGPTDLVQAYGSSAATWSRELSALAAQGVVLKAGQKYQPTEYGRALGGLL